MNPPDPSLTSFPLKLYIHLGRHKNFNERSYSAQKTKHWQIVNEQGQDLIYLDFKHT